MQPQSSLSELMNSLDAATYFFVNSAGFITVTAIIFFVLGLWMGRILWRRYKKRFHEGEEVIEAFKREVALLKRRIAEQSTRHSPGMGPNPLQAIAFRSAVPKAAGEMEQGYVQEIAEPEPTPEVMVRPQGLPTSRAFTLWTNDPGWNPVLELTRRIPSQGRMGSGGTDSARSVPGITGEILTETPGHDLLHVFMVPRSKAFTLWTEASWNPPSVRPQPLPGSKGFTLWTLDDFTAKGRGILPPSQAHTIWTESCWNSKRLPGPPLRSSRAFTVWTEEDWAPHPTLPPSKAYTVWTEEGWVPPSLPSCPLPPSAAGSVWMEEGFVPGCRGPLLPSRAFSLWSEADWIPAATVPQPLPTSRAFTVWIEEEVSAIAAAPAAHAPTIAAPKADVPSPPTAVATSAPASATKAPTATKGFFARALAVARQALGIQGDDPTALPPPTPAPIEKPAPLKEAKPPVDQAVASVTELLDSPADLPAETKAPLPSPSVAAPPSEATAPASLTAETGTESPRPEVQQKVEPAPDAIATSMPQSKGIEEAASLEEPAELVSIQGDKERPEDTEPPAAVTAEASVSAEESSAGPVKEAITPDEEHSPDDSILVEAEAETEVAVAVEALPAVAISQHTPAQEPLTAIPVTAEEGAESPTAAVASPKAPAFTPAPPRFPKLAPMPVPEHAPARTAEPAKVSVKAAPPAPVPPTVAASLAATAAAVEALRKSGRVPVMGQVGTPPAATVFPPSKAFTLWTYNPAMEPVSKITQRIALAALIESKIATGKIPIAQMMASIPTSPMVPPVPMVITGAVPPMVPNGVSPAPIPLAIPLPVEPLPQKPAEGDA